MTVNDASDPQLDTVVAHLKARPVDITPAGEVVARGRRRRRRTRLATGAASLLVVLALVPVALRFGDPSTSVVATTPTVSKGLVLPDGTRLDLTMPADLSAAGTEFAVAAMPPPDPAVTPPCCAREIVVYDSTSLATADAARPVAVESAVTRSDGVEVQTVRTPRGEIDLRFDFGSWVAVVPVRGGGLPFTMDPTEEALWHGQLTGNASDDGVVLTLPAEWTFREAALPIARIGDVGVLGPETRDLQCQGPAHQAGPWTVHEGNALRLCQPGLPFVVGLSADTADETIEAISLSVTSAGPLADGL